MLQIARLFLVSLALSPTNMAPQKWSLEEVDLPGTLPQGSWW